MVGEKKPSPGKCNSLHQHLFPIFVYSHSTLAAEYEISWFSRSYKWLTANCFPSVLHERTILHSLHRILCMDSCGLLCSSTSTFFILAFSRIRCGSSCYSCFQRSVTRMPYTENELIMWLLLPLYCVARKESFSMWRWWLRCQ